MVEINDVIKQPVNTVNWVLTDKDGHIKASGLTKNQVQTAHATALATQVDSSPAQASGLYQFMWVGTGAVGGVGATGLTAAIAGGNQAVTSSTSAGAVVTTVATFAPATGTGAITEVGLFTANNNTTMMCTASLVCTKGVGDTLAVTWTCTFS